MKTSIFPDRAEDRLTVSYTDEVQTVLDHNKNLRTTQQHSDWGRHIATIPPIVMVQWLNEELAKGHNVRYLSSEWDEIVARKLNDPDWAYLRTDGPRFRAGYDS